MVSEALALLGLFVTMGLGIAFGAATISFVRRDAVQEVITGFAVTSMFFMAAFLLAKYLGI